MRKALAVFLGIAILIMGGNLLAGNCGDVNSDGDINILDIVYLINYKYKSGAEPDCGTVTDIDGNVYQTVTIGTQVWMMENLKVTHYRNGDPIPHVTDNGEWESLSEGACWEYDNEVHNVPTHGRLYNWFAVNDSRNICPEGWHVPTDEEWKQLEMYLGMSQSEADATVWRGTDEGGKLKEAGYAHWFFPNTGATNESGFTASANSNRYYDGTFINMRYSAHYWSLSASGSLSAWYRYLGYNNSEVGRNSHNKNCGFTVRCVKD